MSLQKPGPFNLGQSMNEALALQRQGQLREAEKIYTRVLKAAPDYFDALNLLGTVKAQLGRFGDAQRLLASAVKINPRSPQALANLGQVLQALKRPPEALDCLARARALAPDDIAILNSHANALLSLDRQQEALAEFEMVLARVPQHAEAWLNSGIAHAALGFPQRALAAFDRALSIVPGHPAATYNRGLAMYELGRYADAIAAYECVLAVVAEHPGAWLNRGRALAALNRLDDAIASYDKTLTIRKDDADAHFMEALALLARGAYRRGFEKYEWRWRRTGMPAQKSRGRPLWHGEYPLARKSILIHAEQGFGDTIQFARYVPLLAARGAHIVLEVHPELTALMTRLDGASAIIRRGDTPPPYDVHCPLGSLPLAFKTELGAVPAEIPYLSADEAHLAKWSARIGGLGRPRIAVAWAGNPSHVNDRNRSIGFGLLAPLFSLAGQAEAGRAAASFISLQRDLRGEDAAALAGETRVMHIGDALEDFTDTAAVMALCDLVITVDTAVAHLAGAMGRPVWVLLPFAPDWRWTIAGDSTPWYPSARLFRQPTLGDWTSVVADVGAALSGMLPR